MRKSSTQLGESPLQMLRRITSAERARLRAEIAVDVEMDPRDRRAMGEWLEQIAAEEVEEQIDRAFMPAHRLIQVARKTTHAVADARAVD